MLSAPGSATDSPERDPKGNGERKRSNEAAAPQESNLHKMRETTTRDDDDQRDAHTQGTVHDGNTSWQYRIF